MNRFIPPLFLASAWWLAAPRCALGEEAGLPFLKMNVGARSVALGGACLAGVRDASAVSWNPSALAILDQSQVLAYHSQFVSNYLYDYLAAAFPGRVSGFGVGVGYLSKGSFQGRDGSGRPTGDFSASDGFLTFGYGRKLNQNFSSGLAADLIRSSIADRASYGIALNLAVTGRLASRTRGALGIFHWGPSMKYANQSFPLPATLAAGVSQQIWRSLSLASDLRYGWVDRKFDLGVGAELNVAQAAALRLGYSSKLVGAVGMTGSDGALDSLTAFTLGVGVNLFSQGALDYGFVPMGELGGAHHLDLVWKFKSR